MPVNAISSKAYHNHVKGGMELRQSELVVKFLREACYPQTANTLLAIINRYEFKIGIVSLRRTLHNLTVQHHKKGWNNQYGRQVVCVCKEDKCPITKVNVGWYQLMPEFSYQLPLFTQHKSIAA